MENDLCLSLNKIILRFQNLETKKAHFFTLVLILNCWNMFLLLKIFLCKLSVHTLGSRILAYLIFF